MFEEKEQELKEKGLWRAEELEVYRLIFGNQHEKIMEPKKARKRDGYKQNTERWAMFLSIENNTELTSKFFNRVKYICPKTFNKKVSNKNEPPFLFACYGWGIFPVKALITFQRWTKIGQIEVWHLLSFNPGGKVFQFDLTYQEREE